MVWIAGFFVVVVFVGLAALFTAAAFAIKRDVKERFERIETRLRDDAERILRNLSNDR